MSIQKLDSLPLQQDKPANDNPIHLAIIPDGNRRFAKKLLKEPWKGHEWGLEKIRHIFDWCKGRNVEAITIYALSLENIKKRPSYEMEFLYSIARKEINDVISNKNNFIHKDNIRLHFFGNLHVIPKDLQDSMKKAMEITSSYTNCRINFAIAYGGRQEIVNACREIARKAKSNELGPEDINEGMLRKSLLTNGSRDPDLVIRTGGEKRFSNFLIFQSAYSELEFTDTLWPEITKREITSIIDNFRQRERRFGR